MQDFLSQDQESYFEKIISKQGKIFAVRANLFKDGSFEVILSDITKEEKTRRLKQEMTGNIAHELRTPITSIRGYLETVLDQPLSDEKKQYFIERAFHQTIALSEIIQDMSLITKMEEAPNLFNLEKTNIKDVTVQMLGEAVDVVATDISFISVLRIIPAVKSILKEEGALIILIKPQFEAGKEKVGKGGVIRDPLIHEEVIRDTIQSFEE